MTGDLGPQVTDQRGDGILCPLLLPPSVLRPALYCPALPFSTLPILWSTGTCVCTCVYTCIRVYVWPCNHVRLLLRLNLFPALVSGGVQTVVYGVSGVTDQRGD